MFSNWPILCREISCFLVVLINCFCIAGDMLFLSCVPPLLFALKFVFLEILFA